MTFIKNMNELFNAADSNLYQTFRRRPNWYNGDEYEYRQWMNDTENSLLDIYDHDEIDDTDVGIAHFIYEVKMCTFEQIQRYFQISDDSDLQNRLHVLRHAGVINYFAISDEKQRYIPEDALRIYIFDKDGIALLNHFYDDLDILNWNPKSQVLNGTAVAGKVCRTLLATEFMTLIKEKNFVLPSVYTPYSLITFGRFRIVPQAQIQFQYPGIDNGTANVIVICCIRNDKRSLEGTRFSDMLGRYEEWFTRKGWKNYYDDPPYLIIICDSKEAEEYAEQSVKEIHFNEISRIENGKVEENSVLLSDKTYIASIEDLKKSFENSLYSYDSSADLWTRSTFGVLKEK